MLMSGAVVAAYQLVDAAHKTDTTNTTQEEGNFVVHKIDWTLNGITTITMPNASQPYARTLDVVSNNGTHVVVRFNTATRAIEMSEDSSEYTAITTSNASTTNLQFHYLSAVGSPSGIEASTTIDGVVFYTKEYIRK